MKVDIIGKYKWYIMGIIAVVVIMSIGLSFCVWDTTTFKSVGDIKGSTADYNKNMYKIAVDNNNNTIADVGDIVTFGNYYQAAEATALNPIKAPIRWIVVDKAPNTITGVQELTLLAESVMAFGNFWGRCYHNGSSWVWEGIQQYYQNYSVSTLDMWLNSNYAARHDQGTAFTATANKLGMRGFMNEAFTADERAYINSRTISGIKGYSQNSNKVSESYDLIERKVWVPSLSEIYGGTTMTWGAHSDGSPNTQFSYFRTNTANSLKIGKTTAFASTPRVSNYTIAGDTSHKMNAQNTTLAGAVAWWRLRSPHPTDYNGTVVVNSDGAGTFEDTYLSDGGVRPAIAVPA